MKFPGTWHEHFERRWHISMVRPQGSKADGSVMSLYGVRIAALIVVTCAWVALTLATGLFSVTGVIFVGAAIGSAHLVLPKAQQRRHLFGALTLTLVGGLLANVFAGLALFSATVGVSYWQVLLSQQFPQDLPVLFSVFVDSFRSQDLAYYLLAMVAAFYLTALKTKRTDP